MREGRERKVRKKAREENRSQANGGTGRRVQDERKLGLVVYRRLVGFTSLFLPCSHSFCSPRLSSIGLVNE